MSNNKKTHKTATIYSDDNIASTTNNNDYKVKKVEEKTKNEGQNPYHFVPVKVSLALTDTPIWHDGSNPKQKELFTGELLCTMTTLTPTLVGNNTYAIGNAKFDPKYQNIDDEKTVIEPLRLSDGRVVISGSSIKGMLRHSLGALLSAPMERVQEQEYGYRPNSQFGSKLESLPFIFTGIDEETGDYKIKIMNNPNFLKSENSETKNEKVFKYFGAIDGCGELAKHFNSRLTIYERIGISNYDYENGESAILDKNLVEHYKSTLNFIKDDKTGHISSRHPDSGNHKTIAQSINNILNLFKNTDQLFYKVVFFLEIDKNTKKIVTFGHNFRYLTKYRDSIHKKAGKYREELVPKDLEKKDIPEKLTAARLLFGYASSDDEIGSKGIGKNDYSHLAGRIAINHAVEVVENPNDNSRFLDQVFLKELGSPKASAVEFYINQKEHKKDQLNTYGDDIDGTNAGDFNGRKFYLHQPDAAKASIYEEKNPIERATKRSSIARFVSKPGTKFKFTIRYKDLRDWELATLKFLLEMDIKELNEIENQDYIKQLKTEKPFAHKIGYAKPLGFGSVTINIDNKDNLQKDNFIKLAKQHFSTDYKNWEKEILIQWLKIHQYENRSRSAYRTLSIKGKNTIFNYHSMIRQHHLSIRKGGKPKIGKKIDDIVLKELN